MFPVKDDIPSPVTPFVTIAIVLIDSAIFLYQASLGPRGEQIFLLKAGLIPYEVTHGVDLFPSAYGSIWLTPLSAMFLHGGFGHLFGNMLFLWIFGDNVEASMGHGRFAVFYVLLGLIASTFHVLSDPSSRVPMIGASGAIAGVLGAYTYLFPRAGVTTVVFIFFFIRLIKVPALIFLGFWFLLQLLSAASGSGGVAWFAHIGGFVAGLLLVRIFTQRPPRRPRTYTLRYR